MNGAARRLGWLALLAGSMACRAPAQESAAGTRTVPVRVVSAGGDSVYLDHGRDIDLRVGDRVALFPPGGGEVEVVVRSLTHSSARCEPLPGVPLPPVGTSGEAVVPLQQPQPRASAPGRSEPRVVPEHPPWTRPVGPRAAGQPLLVPTYGQRPDERPVDVRGRLFGIGQWNRDRDDGGDSDYLLVRTGLRADVTNALGQAERVRFAGEWSLRQVDVDGGIDETDHTGRIDLASVTFGDQDYAPLGAEVGRFLSRHLPEIGLVDGAELVLRYEGGVRVGGGFGAYPRPFPARNTGEDVGVHAFVDYVSDAERTFAFALGAQKTWHEGAPDRDLVILRGEWRPAEQWSLLGNAKVDFYSGSDTVESRSVELTELLLQLRWSGRDGGVALVGSHFGWPELKRFEYQLLSPELVRDGAVDRASLAGWWRAAGWCTLRLRGDRFEDQQRDGTSARADADLRGLLGDGSNLRLSAFRSEGSYTSGPGASAVLQHRLAGARWRLGYRWHRYSLDTLIGGADERVRESVQLGCSWPIGARCEVDLQGERWFGDGQDAFSLGLFVQWRL